MQRRSMPIVGIVLALLAGHSIAAADSAVGWIFASLMVGTAVYALANGGSS